MIALELVEKHYRDTPVTHKKHVKRLTDFIDYLIKERRIIEAKHFFVKLYELKPHHSKVIRLGYELSIATFDKDGVKKFDKLFLDSKPTDAEVIWFQLKYYHSVNNRQMCAICCEQLLSKKISQEYLQTVSEVCVKQNSYAIAVSLLNYLERERLRLRPSDSGYRHLKKVLVQGLADTIVRVKNAQLSCR